MSVPAVAGVPCRGCGRPYNPTLDLTPLGLCQRCANEVTRLVVIRWRLTRPPRIEPADA
jgi:hypothetical protein